MRRESQMLITKRKAKNSTRGLYLHDKGLLNTMFQTGTPFRYIVDINNREIVILPVEGETANTVSRKKYKDGYKPVIDIRNKKALQAFKGCDYLQIEVYNERIVVRGYIEETNHLVGGKKSLHEFGGEKSSKVISIESLIQVREVAQMSLSKKQLQQAVGDSVYHQLDIFEVDTPFNTDANLVSIEAFKQAAIPLKVLSLFSGAGMFDLAFKEMGMDIVFALEKDPGAVETYRHNIGNHILQADITKIDLDKFEVPQVPIVIGGSPCKGFVRPDRVA